MTEPNPPAAPASGVRTVRVLEDRDGQRIDNFLLGYLKGAPRSLVYKLLRSGQVRVNGGRVRAERRLEAGGEVRTPPIRLPDPAEKGTPPQGFMDALDAAIVFEDARLLALNKPSGVASHGGSGISFGAIETLRALRPKDTLELVHRLDRDTSGLLVVAKKRSALGELQALLREDHGAGISKRYLALVKGRWHNELQHVRLPLHKYLTAEGERRVSVNPEGKAAHSIVRLVARWENFSLVEVELKTGRTHQIRVHLAHLGFPIAGDDKYGDFPLNRALQKTGLGRMFLHAAKLALPHPLSGAPVELESPLPAELRSFTEILDGNEKRGHGSAF